MFNLLKTDLIFSFWAITGAPGPYRIRYCGSIAGK